MTDLTEAVASCLHHPPMMMNASELRQARAERQRKSTKAYDEAEHPRDESGKWTTGGGDGGGSDADGAGAVPKPFISADAAAKAEGYEFVSSNTGNLDLKGAYEALSSPRHAMLTTASREVDSELGLRTNDHDAIGAWKDGAEDSMMTIVQGATWDQVVTSAAMKGHLGYQKAVLAFQQQEGGTAALAKLTVPGTYDDLETYHDELLKDGLEFHTIVAGRKNLTIYVADLDGSAGPGIAKAAERYETNAEIQFGRAEFIGTNKSDGTEREQRDDARRVFETVIKQSPVQRSTEVWNRIHHRWGEALDPTNPHFERGKNGEASQKLIDYAKAGGQYADIVRVGDHAITGFLLPDGRLINNGDDHSYVADEAGTKLKDVLADGGARIYYYPNDYLGVEIHERPSQQEVNTLKAAVARGRLSKVFIDTDLWRHAEYRGMFEARDGQAVKADDLIQAINQVLPAEPVAPAKQKGWWTRKADDEADDEGDDTGDEGDNLTEVELWPETGEDREEWMDRCVSELIPCIGEDNAVDVCTSKWVAARRLGKKGFVTLADLDGSTFKLKIEPCGKSCLGCEGAEAPFEARAFDEGEHPRDEHGRWTSGGDAGGGSDKPSGSQTETEAFKKWFGDSKVVDGHGDPLVVYHGTSADFASFKTASGAWFSADPKLAVEYSGAKGEQPNIYPVYLRVENPVVINRNMNDYATFAEMRKETGLEFTVGPYGDEVVDGVEQTFKVHQIIADVEFATAAKEAGYDGIEVREGEANTYGVFDPTQVKSATGNTGAFDPNDPDISKEFNEDEHPRDESGRWTSGGSDGGGGKVTSDIPKAPKETGKPQTVYHGSKAAGFEEFKLPDPAQEKMVDRAIGIHVAKDPKLAETFTNIQNPAPVPWGEKPLTQVGGIYILEIPPDNQFHEVPQPQYPFVPPGTPRGPKNVQTDQNAIGNLVYRTAFKKDAGLFARFIERRWALPKERAEKIADDILHDRPVKEPLISSRTITGLDDYISLDIVSIWDDKERVKAVQLFHDEFKDKGWVGLKYLNTSPMETEKADDPTSYIVFDPADIKFKYGKDGKKLFIPFGLVRDFEKSQHPRDEHGRWTDGGGDAGSDKPTSEKPPHGIVGLPADAKLKFQTLEEAIARDAFDFNAKLSTGSTTNYTVTVSAKKVPGVKELEARYGRTELYDPKLAKIDTLDPGTEFEREIARPKEGLPTEVERLPGDDIIYRGMSFEEFENLKTTGEIKSTGEYNLGEGQVGLTYWSTDPRTAEAYANGFAPWSMIPTFEKPAYVVATHTPKETRVVPGTGVNEVGVARPVKQDEIVGVWKGQVYSHRAGKIDLIPDGYRSNTYREGSRASPSSSVVWLREKEAKKSFDEGQHPRDEHGRWTDGGGGGSDAAEAKPEATDKSPGSEHWKAVTKALNDTAAKLGVAEKLTIRSGANEKPVGEDKDGNQLKPAAYADLQTKTIVAFPDNIESVETVPGVLSHEATHLKYGAVLSQYRKDKEIVGRHPSLVNQSGYLKPQFQDRYPAYQALWKYEHQIEQLKKDDGVTGYSTAWWNAYNGWHPVEKPGDLVTTMHETVAEIGRLEATTGKRDGVSESWSEYYDDVQAVYKAITK